MSQHSVDQVTSRRPVKLADAKLVGKLDRAAFASVAAMVTLCVFVLAQQLQATSLLAIASAATGANLA